MIAILTQNGNRRVLHLLNWTGDAGNEANSLPPVENVTLHMTIPDGAKVRRLSTFLEAPLRRKESGRELEMRLSRVEAFLVVTVEFE